MKPYAAALLDCDEGEVTARNGTMFVESDETRSVPWAEVARQYFNDRGPLVATARTDSTASERTIARHQAWNGFWIGTRPSSEWMAARRS